MLHLINLETEHLVLDRRRRDEAVDHHVTLLADPACSCNTVHMAHFRLGSFLIWLVSDWAQF